MRRLSGTSAVALAAAAFLGSLSLVAWRQGRALELLGDLDQVSREYDMGGAERDELQRRVRFLESRGHVVPEAKERMGMRMPAASEIVILAGAES